MDSFERILQAKLQEQEVLVSLASTGGRIEVSNPYKHPCKGGSFSVGGRIHTPAVPRRSDLLNPAAL